MNFERETDIKYQCGRRHFKWFLGWILPKRIKKKPGIPSTIDSPYTPTLW
jgi:hypothetical protein